MKIKDPWIKKITELEENVYLVETNKLIQTIDTRENFYSSSNTPTVKLDEVRFIVNMNVTSIRPHDTKFIKVLDFDETKVGSFALPGVYTLNKGYDEAMKRGGYALDQESKDLELIVCWGGRAWTKPMLKLAREKDLASILQAFKHFVTTNQSAGVHYFCDEHRGIDYRLEKIKKS